MARVLAVLLNLVTLVELPTYPLHSFLLTSLHFFVQRKVATQCLSVDEPISVSVSPISAIPVTVLVWLATLLAAVYCVYKHFKVEY